MEDEPSDSTTGPPDARTDVGDLIDIIDHPGLETRAVAAATLLLLRESDDGPQVLMIHRGADTEFGGMWAFPGGAVELVDTEPSDGSEALPAARRAAIRETHEEVGLTVDPSSLVLWSHWLPPAETPRRFSTWFFVAPAAERHVEVVIDGNEVHDHRWITPAEALSAQTRGEMLLAPPTFVTLEQLYRYGDVASACAAAAPAHFATEIAFDADGVRMCLWEGDVGYGGGDCGRPGPRRRLEMRDEGWRFLNTV